MRSFGIILILFSWFLFHNSEAQENDFKNTGAYHSLRNSYQTILKEESNAIPSKMYLRLANLEYDLGNLNKAISYWRRTIKYDSTTSHAVIANINLAAVYASMAAQSREEDQPNKYDQLEVTHAQSAVLNYTNLLPSKDYYGFTYDRYLITYKSSSLNYETMKLVFDNMKRQAGSSEYQMDQATWDWAKLNLVAAQNEKTIDELNYIFFQESEYTHRNDNWNESESDRIISGFEEIIKNASETHKSREMLARVKIRYAQYLTKLNELIFKTVNHHGSVMGDSSRYNLQFTEYLDMFFSQEKRIMDLYQEAVSLSFPGFTSSSISMNPVGNQFDGKVNLLAGRKALKGKVEYLLTISRRYYGAFDWPWARHFTLLGFEGMEKGAGADFMSNPTIFKREALKLALNTLQAAEDLNNRVSDKLPTEKDKYEWSASSYEEKILGMDVAFEYFMATNNNPKGVKSFGSWNSSTSSSSMRVTIDKSITENPLFETFYYAEKAKATLLLKELLNRDGNDNAQMNSVNDLSELREKLDGKTALVQYVVSPHNFYQFTITRDYFQVKTRYIDEEDILPRIKGLRNGMIYEDNGIFLEHARYLYKKLIPKLDEEITDLVIIPDRELSLIPFEVLTSRKVKKKDIGDPTLFPFLILDYNVSYAFSAGLWKHSLKEAPNVKSFIAFAPVFPDQNKDELKEATRSALVEFSEENPTRGIMKDGSYITPLPGTEREVDKITALFEEKGFAASKHLKENATEELFKSTEIGDQNYLHLATHGFVNTMDPDKSGIVFSQVNTNEDGVLYTGEIINKELNAYLITLSACETSLGKIVNGEGVIGLSRAFVLSGASNVVASLWQVSDESTALLMTYFYEFLLNEDIGLNHALNKAKLKLISQPRFAAPFYWSPFVLVGN